MTSIRHRLLIDECLPPKLISAYLNSHINLSGDGVNAVHIKDHLGEGKKDPAWVPKIAKDRRWCVLSVDKGSHSGKIDALPIICAEYDVTLIRISEVLRQRSLAYYGPQLLVNWGAIMSALQGPKGAQYLLRAHHLRAELTIFAATRAPDGFSLNNGILVPETPVKSA